jgi:hypothetical protein
VFATCIRFHSGLIYAGKAESKAKTGKRNIKNNPATLGEKKVKSPPTSFRKPGLILPKQCRKLP